MRKKRQTKFTNTPWGAWAREIPLNPAWEELELELRARVVEVVGRGQLVTQAKKGLPANKGKQTSLSVLPTSNPVTGRAGSTEPRDPGRFVSSG